MKIEIVDAEGDLVTDFNLECNPFKVGEKININITNSDPELWTVKELSGVYEVESIGHFIAQRYRRHPTVSESFAVSVQVKKIES